MPCKMGFEHEQYLTEEALKLAQYLSVAIDVLDKDLSQMPDATGPELREWSDRYKTSGKDAFLASFHAQLIPFHEYGMFPADFDQDQVIAKCHGLTAALCNILRLIEADSRLGGCPAEIQEWWMKHKIEDQRRMSSQKGQSPSVL